MTFDNLENELCNDAFFGDGETWDCKKDDELSNIGTFHIKDISPSDAKTIDQVQSFVVEEEVMGSVIYTFERKS